MRVFRITTVDGDMRQHARHPLGIDYTLCGTSLDDDPTVTRSIEEREGSVTCEHCLAMVCFCKAIKL